MIHTVYIYVDIFMGSYICASLIILIKEVIFVEENFAYTQDCVLVRFLYYDFNLSLISSCKKQHQLQETTSTHQLQETTCKHAF